jgi:hypothetical protein
MKKLIFAVALVAGATTAVAGLAGGQQVSIWTDSAGLINANGTLSNTRNSADSVQYIGCSYYTYDSGSASAVCYARSASGQYASCSTTNATLLSAVQTLNPAAYLYFVVNADGTCNRVITVTTSYNLP